MTNKTRTGDKQERIEHENTLVLSALARDGELAIPEIAVITGLPNDVVVKTISRLCRERLCVETDVRTNPKTRQRHLLFKMLTKEERAITPSQVIQQRVMAKKNSVMRELIRELWTRFPEARALIQSYSKKLDDSE